VILKRAPDTELDTCSFCPIQSTKRYQVDELNDRQKKQIDCLLADFSAIKSEIARRSNLQRMVQLIIVAVLAATFTRAASFSLSSLWLVGLWVSSVLAYQFYAREGYEIERLATVIREGIAPIAANILATTPQRLMLSETAPDVPPTRDSWLACARRRAYYRQFQWGLFFVAPLVVTALFIYQRMGSIQNLLNLYSLTPWAALLVGLLGLRSFILLWRDA